MHEVIKKDKIICRYLGFANHVMDLNLPRYRRMFFNDIVEQEERLIKSILAEGSVFIDVGANFGTYSLTAAMVAGPQGKVYSFEPETENYAALESSLKLNNLRNVKIERLALSDSEGTGTLQLYEGPNTGRHSLLHETPGEDEGASVQTQEIQLTTLDNYIAQENIQRCDVVKIDVEGAEIMVLRGATKLLERDVPPVFMVEISDQNAQNFGYDHKEIFNVFKSQGYDSYGYRSHKLTPYTPAEFIDCENVIFIHPATLEKSPLTERLNGMLR